MGDDLMDEILGDLEHEDAPKSRSRLVTPSKAIVGGGNRASRVIVDSNAGLGAIENIRTGNYRDEVDAYLDAKYDASLQEGGDEFRTYMRMQQTARAAISREAPFVSSNPPSAVESILGGQVLCLMGKLAQTVAYWTGKDSDTLPVTCMFGLAQYTNMSTSGKTANDAAFRPYGIVRFGTRGFLTAVTVDIGMGCQFTVSGSQVILDVGIDTASTNTSYVPSANLLGMISFNQIVRTTPITRTFYSDNLTNSSTFLVDVPQFAKRVVVIRAPFNGSFIVEGYQDNGVSNFAQTVAASTMMDTLTLPGDTNQILVTNNSGSTLTSVRVIFELSL